MAGEKSIKKVHDEVYLGMEKDNECFFHLLIFVEQVKKPCGDMQQKNNMSKVKQIKKVSKFKN